MAAVTFCSDFGAQENKICHCFIFSPIFPFSIFFPEQECSETKGELKSRGFEMVRGGHSERCIWAEIKKARGRKYWCYGELRKQCSWQRKPQVQRPWGEPGEDQWGENGRDIHPGELPLSLCTPLKNLSPTFWFKAIAAGSVCASQGPRVPHFAPKASQSVA